MRFLPFLVLATACRPTSMLELTVFVSADVLNEATAPAAVHIDFGTGQTPLAISLCEWDENEFREVELPEREFGACADTRTIVGAVAPFPEGNTCNNGSLLNIVMAEESDWVGSGTVDVFETDDCSIIESQTLIIE